MRFDLLSNIDDVIAEIEGQMPTEAAHELEIINDTEYAAYLQRKFLLWVTNDGVLKAFLEEELEIAIDTASLNQQHFSSPRWLAAEKRALRRTVEWYQNVIGYKDTPGKVKLPPRPLHPGGWADDTETLVNAYVSYIRVGAIIKDFSTYRLAG